jgi:DNA-binding XRE family transcriptional regulator
MSTSTIINTSDLLNKHQKGPINRIIEWMDVHNLTNDAKILIMCAVATSAKQDIIRDHILSESKLIKGELTNKNIWESLEINKGGVEFNESKLSHYINLAKDKFNALVKQYPISPDKNYNLDLFEALMTESALTIQERKELVKAFVIGNNDVVVESYNSGINKMSKFIVGIEEQEPFDFELSSTIFMESNRINEEYGADEVQDANAEKEREKEKAEQTAKNQEEFADQNAARAKNQNAPLAKALRAQGVSQDEAADLLDVDKSTISRIKNGDRKPSFDLLKKISKKFGSVDNLFPELT